MGRCKKHPRNPLEAVIMEYHTAKAEDGQENQINVCGNRGTARFGRKSEGTITSSPFIDMELPHAIRYDLPHIYCRYYSGPLDIPGARLGRIFSTKVVNSIHDAHKRVKVGLIQSISSFFIGGRDSTTKGASAQRPSHLRWTCLPESASARVDKFSGHGLS